MEAINIYPELIKWKPNKQGLVPITIRFDYKRKRAGNESLNHRIHPDAWDGDKRRVTNKCSDHVLLNQLIENRLHKHRNYILKRQTFDLPISLDLLKKYLKSGKGNDCFYDYAADVIKTKKLKDGKCLSDDTKRRYDDEIKRMMQYKESLSFNQVDVNYLQRYKLWMCNEYKKKDGTRLHKNSIWKALSFVRMVYNQAIDDQLILSENNPFKQFAVGSFEQDVDKIKYLDLDEVEKIEMVLTTKANLLDKTTLSVGWRFLAMCVSGIRISDAMMLDDMMFNDAGNLELIPHKTKRWGNKAHIPIVSDRQRRYMSSTLENKLPPRDAKIYRKVFNDHLKLLCVAAEIKSVTSHAGRHTMGSFLVDAGVQEKAAMAMLGVKSEKVIKTYMHLKEKKLLSEAEKLKSIF